MKVEAIKAYLPNGCKLWLGFIWQLHPRLSRHYAFSPRLAAWAMIRAHRGIEKPPPRKGGPVG
ncbi:hypothetical protein [Amycolatopsis kentuckyensis]|uniref:hypothetical protein n=1 Tax=Amycolatopsis kentuckyensis TaxID=218823 RepID=UPI000A3A33E2|nr:hypothetical protein [Amycolatopsis kentuckyensis]